jgi:hypothetical protein
MMTLTIEWPPEIEQRLTEAAARQGRAPAEYVRAVVEEKLAAPPTMNQRTEQRQQNQAALALLRQWREEDAENPDPNPVPDIPPLSLREVKID